MSAIAVHFGAFDAEAQWRSSELATLPEVKDSGAQRIVDAMAELSWAFAAPGDIIASPPIDEALQAALAALGITLRYGGETRGADPAPYAIVDGIDAEIARLELDQTRPLPSVAVAQRVNSKIFSNTLALAAELDGVAEVATSTEQLGMLARSRLSHGSVVLKDPYGVSGRGSCVVSSDATLARVLAHVGRQERDGKRVELLVQPQFARELDFSCHFEVTREGWSAWGVQHVDNDGMSFRAVRQPDELLIDRIERRGQWRVIDGVARALSREGYAGPVCVDAMFLTDGRTVPLLEINARKSMGLLHLRLRTRFLLGPAVPSELACWHLGLRGADMVTCERLLAGLRSEALLFDGRRGLVVLGSRTLRADARRGRLYGMLVWDVELPRTQLVARVRATLTRLDAEVRGGPRE